MDYQQQADDFAKKHGITMEILGSEFRKHFKEDKQNREVYRIRLKRGGEHYDFDFGSSIQDSCEPTPAINTEGEAELYTGIMTVVADKRDLAFAMSFKMTYADLRKIDNKELSAQQYFDTNLEQAARAAHAQYETAYNTKVSKQPSYLRSRKRYEVVIPYQQAVNSVINRILKAIEETKKNTALWDRKQTPDQPTMYDILCCLTKYDPGTFENFCSDFGYDSDSRSAERTYNAVVEEYNNMARVFTPEILEEMQEIQ